VNFPSMPFLRLSCLPAILAVSLAASAPAGAQTTPPADIPGAASDEGGDGGEAAQYVLRIGRLEQALRQANGRIEELQNAQRRLEEQFQKFRQDVEFRFGDKSGAATPPLEAAPAPVAAGSSAAPVVEATPLPKPRRSDAFDPNATPNAPGPPQPLGSTAPSAPLKTASAAGPPLDLGSRAPAPTPTPTGPTIVGSGVAMVDQPRDQFNNALQAFQSGQYPQAEEGFKAFMAANPGHRLTPDAVFYIGETYFQRSQPRQAAEQYLKVSTDFSKSSRAPESLVRLGQTLVALGNTEQACATFEKFGRDYPNASPSVKRLAAREIAKDHC
jgi:tol-pal system protein YbgF